MTTIDTHASGAAEPGAGLAGVADWLTTTDHKRIGRLYVGVSLVALVGSLVVAALLAAERISTSGTIVELGSGTSDKTRTLLDAFAAAGQLPQVEHPVAFVRALRDFVR